MSCQLLPCYCVLSSLQDRSISDHLPCSQGTRPNHNPRQPLLDLALLPPAHPILPIYLASPHRSHIHEDSLLPSAPRFLVLSLSSSLRGPWSGSWTWYNSSLAFPLLAALCCCLLPVSSLRRRAGSSKRSRSKLVLCRGARCSLLVYTSLVVRPLLFRHQEGNDCAFAEVHCVRLPGSTSEFDRLAPSLSLSP